MEPTELGLKVGSKGPGLLSKAKVYGWWFLIESTSPGKAK